MNDWVVCTLTGNEIGNYGRHGVKPVIFVLNNSGFAVERAFEEYPDWVYNDIAPWNYHTLPAALGCRDWFTATVKTNGELEAAMQKAEAADAVSYIEIIGGKHDYPADLKLVGSRGYEMYGIWASWNRCSVVYLENGAPGKLNSNM